MSDILIGLDRDGTINYGIDYLGKDDNWKEEVSIYPGVVEGIKKLKSLDGSKVIVATNQLDVARGYFGVNRAKEINQYIDELLKVQGAYLDGWYLCYTVSKNYAKSMGLDENNPWIRDNDLRKPGIGMLRIAAKDMGFNLKSLAMKNDNSTGIYFIGDRVTDVLTGLNAKGKSVFLLNGKNNNEYKRARKMLNKYSRKIYFAYDFLAAAEMIIYDQKTYSDANNKQLTGKLPL